ncbi:hypothetical protein [Bernardetia sp.]|uniref:hypothetical protein n=1 Tax=Bernardetia sp. TaxID=1937974 RepID=UPI0025BB404A|nr:hypothetical protein [Bernardetia sp.]
MDNTIVLTLEDERVEEAIYFLQKTIPSVTPKLSSVAKPHWGKMTPQHMIEHLHTSVIASTIIKKTPPLPPNTSQKEAKQFLIYSPADMPRNLDNPAFRFGLPDYKNPSLEEAKTKLLSSLNRFFEIYEGKEEDYNFNLFFGDLHRKETIVMHHKHFKHHYMQFGLL